MANIPLQILAALRFLHFTSLSLFFKIPTACGCFSLTVAEVTAGGAVLLHQAALAVTVAPASPGRTDE